MSYRTAKRRRRRQSTHDDRIARHNAENAIVNEGLAIVRHSQLTDDVRRRLCLRFPQIVGLLKRPHDGATSRRFAERDVFRRLAYIKRYDLWAMEVMLPNGEYVVWIPDAPNTFSLDGWHRDEYGLRYFGKMESAFPQY